jgi:C4-dicarboxylate-specific signal transduction histidine kinase
MTKIKIKVIASYCLFLALLISIAGFGIYSVATLRAANHQIIHREVAIGIAAQDLRYSISRIRQKEKSLFISVGREFNPQRDDHSSQEIEDFNRYLTRLIEDIDKLSRLPISEQSASFTVTMQAETTLYQNEVNAIFNDIANGKITTARQADDRLIPFKKLIRDNRDGIQEILTHSKNNLQAATISLEKTSKEIEHAIIFLAALATFLGLFAAIYTSRQIARAEQTNNKLKDELEQRVKERTQALEQSNLNLSQTLRHLEGAKDELVRNEKLVSLGSLVAGIAHELNTPIGIAVLTASTLHDEAKEFKQVMEQGISRSALKHYVDHNIEGMSLISGNLGRAAHLIGSFKELSVDQTSERRRNFSLGEVVDEIVLSLGPSLKSTSHRIAIEIPRDITMDGYPGPLGQICINLINNALIHGLDEKINGIILIQAHEIDHEYVQLSLSDNGKGMSKEVAHHVFDPFFSTKMGQGGSGLGMHIVYSIITKYFGGKIHLETELGQGSRWILTLKKSAPAVPATSTN